LQRISEDSVTNSSKDYIPIRAGQLAIKAPRGIAVPAVIAGAGDHAARRFLEFFAATIRNKNTRMAYYRAVTEFFAWVDRYKIGQLVDIEPLHVAAYVEALGTRMAKPTVKQHLAAVCMCFDWLVTGGVLTVNLTTDQARASGQHRHLDPRRAARPCPDRRHDLCVRACRRRRRDGGLSSNGTELLGKDRRPLGKH